jgi:hypothetical protein
MSIEMKNKSIIIQTIAIAITPASQNLIASIKGILISVTFFSTTISPLFFTALLLALLFALLLALLLLSLSIASTA